MNKEYRINRDEEYLAHHGVKGQKWGVRNEEEPTGRQRKGSGDTDLYEYNSKTQSMQRINRDEYAKRGVKAAGAASGIVAGLSAATIGYAVVSSMKDVNLGKALGAVGLISAGVGVATGFLGAHVQKKDNQRQLAKLEAQGHALQEHKIVVDHPYD